MELGKALVFTRQVSSSPTMSATPILHHSITPILHHSITPLLHYSITPPLHFVRLDRQENTKGGSFAGFAFDLNFAVVRLDNHLALEHADAEAALFRGLKRAEE